MFSWSEKKEKVVLYIYGINFEPNPGLWHLWHCEVGSKLTANPKNSNSTSTFPLQMYHNTKSRKVKKQIEIFVLKALCWKQATGTDIPTLPLRPSSPVWTFPCLANTFDRLQMVHLDKFDVDKFAWQILLIGFKCLTLTSPTPRNANWFYNEHNHMHCTAAWKIMQYFKNNTFRA